MSRLLVLLGTAAALAVAVPLVLGAGSGDDRVGVTLELRDAGGLRGGSQVRVGGAPVGSVRSLRITARNTAQVQLKVDRDATPGFGASASLRALNLLGEKFVDLDLGDRARPLRPLRIPLARTSVSVEIDDLLDVLDPTTRDRLGVLIGELGITLGHRGTELRQVIAGLPPTLQDATTLLRQLGEDTDVLDRLLVEGDRVTTEVARERAGLGRLVVTANRAFAAPAANQSSLQASVQQTPATLRQLRETLRQLDAAGSDLRPAARGLRATAPVLTTTLRALPGFRQAAAPALRTARTTGPALGRLGRGAAPVVRRLRGTSASLAALAAEADPLLSRIDQTFAADLLSVMQGWAQAIQTRDGVGHLFRVSLALTPDTLRALDRFVTGTARRRNPVARRPGAGSSPPSPVPAVPATAKQTEREVKRGADAAVKPVTSVVDAVGAVLEGPADGPSRPSPTAPGASTGGRGLSSFLGEVLGR